VTAANTTENVHTATPQKIESPETYGIKNSGNKVLTILVSGYKIHETKTKFTQSRQ
jgi:hypothetical protein